MIKTSNQSQCLPYKIINNCNKYELRANHDQNFKLIVQLDYIISTDISSLQTELRWHSVTAQRAQVTALQPPDDAILVINMRARQPQ